MDGRLEKKYYFNVIFIKDGKCTVLYGNIPFLRNTHWITLKVKCHNATYSKIKQEKTPDIKK